MDERRGSVIYDSRDGVYTVSTTGIATNTKMCAPWFCRDGAHTVSTIYLMITFATRLSETTIYTPFASDPFCAVTSWPSISTMRKESTPTTIT